jgi:ribosomal protein S3
MVYWMVHRHIHVRIYIDNKPYSTMVHRQIHVRSYIDNKPYNTMVHRHIHVRTYIDKKQAVQWFTDTYMYLHK